LQNVRASLISNKQDSIPISVPVTSGSSVPYSISIPDTATIGQRYLQANGVLQLSQAGIPKASIDLSLQEPLTLIPAPGFPAVSIPHLPTVVNIGDSFSVPIRVTGSARGDGGCITVGHFKPMLHAGKGIKVASLRTSLPHSCMSIGRSRVKTFLVTGVLTKGSDGDFAISTSLRLGSADKGQSYEAPSVFLNMRANVPVNVGGSILLFLFFVILSVLGILLMSLLVNSTTGRFAPRNLVLAKSVEAQYSPEGLRGPGGTSLELGPLLAENTIDYSQARVRAFSLNSNGRFLDFEASNLRKPTTWVIGLFKGPQAQVSARGEEIVVGGSGIKLSGPTPKPCTIPQDLNEFWVFTVLNVEGGENSDVDPVTGSRRPIQVTGNLTVFLRNGGGPAALAKLQSSAELGIFEVANRFKPKQHPLGRSSDFSGTSLLSGGVSQDLSSTTDFDNGI
jgi:hypothetical protein